jgi:hypothetical protein
LLSRWGAEVWKTAGSLSSYSSSPNKMFSVCSNLQQ